MTKKINYSEPKDYIPKDLRKKYGLGEFAQQEEPKKDEKKSQRKRRIKKSIQR